MKRLVAYVRHEPQAETTKGERLDWVCEVEIAGGRPREGKHGGIEFPSSQRQTCFATSATAAMAECEAVALKHGFSVDGRWSGFVAHGVQVETQRGEGASDAG